MRYRLQYNSSTIDPFWQVLMEDVHFNCIGPHVLYKREYKQPSRGSEKNVVLALGNMTRLYSRKDYSFKKVIKLLKRSGIWIDIKAYYYSKGMTREHLLQHLQMMYEDKIYQGKHP